MNKSIPSRYTATILVVFGLAASIARGQAPGDDALPPPPGESQENTEESRLKKLDDAAGDAARIVDEKVRREKEKLLPPFELIRTRVAPLDTLPYIKADHWSTVTFEIRSNLDDYKGIVATEAIPLGDSARSIVYRRDAFLSKAKTAALALSTLFPAPIPKQFYAALGREGAIAPDANFSALLKPLYEHQMLILVLARDPNAYAVWNKMSATIPIAADRDPSVLDNARYYRFVIPLDSKKPAISANPLAWTTISHVVWDDAIADSLSLDQQRALVDWVHWGGQLIVSGGATPWYATLKETAIGPFLPADVSGTNRMMGRSDWDSLAKEYRPLRNVESVFYVEEDQASKPSPLIDVPVQYDTFGLRIPDPRYKRAVPINPDAKRPVFFNGLVPKTNVASRVFRLKDEQRTIFAVERRVGRGRILMLAFNPNDPAILGWPGIDTFTRRVLLRRPEEVVDHKLAAELARRGAIGSNYAQYGMLSGPRLSWLRFASRDIGAATDRSIIPMRKNNPGPDIVELDSMSVEARSKIENKTVYETIQADSPRGTVSAWRDDSRFPAETRRMLEISSGIRVPARSFILTVLICYIIALVPLNWIICRYVFKRAEIAWAITPFLALGFAIGVERAAAFDLGYDVASNEIDLIELQPGYDRAHLARFGSIYSSSRKSFTIAFPENATALALPMRGSEGVINEQSLETVFQSVPYPALSSFPVQPRSISLYRAEEMTATGGAIALEREGDGKEWIRNDSTIELRDAELIDVDLYAKSEKKKGRIRIGTIAPKTKVAVPGSTEGGASSSVGIGSASTAALDDRGIGKLDPADFLEMAASYRWDQSADRGELRLVAWTAGARDGASITPEVERKTGMTIVVAHLRYGSVVDPTPDPASAEYDVLATFQNQPEVKEGERADPGNIDE